MAGVLGGGMDTGGVGDIRYGDGNTERDRDRYGDKDGYIYRYGYR